MDIMMIIIETDRAIRSAKIHTTISSSNRSVTNTTLATETGTISRKITINSSSNVIPTTGNIMHMHKQASSSTFLTNPINVRFQVPPQTDTTIDTIPAAVLTMPMIRTPTISNAIRTQPVSAAAAITIPIAEMVKHEASFSRHDTLS